MRIPLEWLKEFVDIRTGPQTLARALTMGGIEVEATEGSGQDTVMEIAVTPNRGDCLSLTGIAREVAAIKGLRASIRTSRPPKGDGKMGEMIRVKVTNPSRCPRYTARVIRGVKIGQSPPWIQRRLAACGVRQINNVVDATNYVMLETGQPLHAFDLGLVRGGRIVVRVAGSEMKFSTLDGIERPLMKDDLVISDGEGPVAIAGIMGGQNSEVNASTTDLFLESASFEPTGIRRTSKRLGLVSESSRRFERGVDPGVTLTTLHRLTEIILETAGGVPSQDWVDLYPKKIKPRKIILTEDEVQRILGIRIGSTRMRKVLGGLGFGVKAGAKKLSVTVPTFRPDVSNPADLIEEVARIVGYDKIPETMPKMRLRPIMHPPFQKQEMAVRNALVSAGFTEALLYSFTSQASLEPFAEIALSPVAITNPISLDQCLMSTTLLAGLIDALKLNTSRQRPDLKLFALQRTYNRPKPTTPAVEPLKLAGVMSGRRWPSSWERSREEVDFYDAKGAVELIMGALGLRGLATFRQEMGHTFLHPGSFAYVTSGGKQLGFVGELHPEVAAKWDIKRRTFIFELNFEALAELTETRPKFSEISRLPFVERDISIVIEDKVPAAEVERAISDSGALFVERLRIFDVYRGGNIRQGLKSLSFTVRFAQADRTLTDGEVDEALGRIIGELKRKLGAELRT